MDLKLFTFVTASSFSNRNIWTLLRGRRWGSPPTERKPLPLELNYQVLWFFISSESGLGHFYQEGRIGIDQKLATFAVIKEGGGWNYRLLGKGKFQI